MNRIIRLKFRQLAYFALSLALLFLTGGDVIGQDMTSPLIKTGLLHKFVQHVTWQQEEIMDTFRIGVYGEEPDLMTNLLLLESVNLKDKPVSIRQFRQLDDISGIHLLYLTRDKNSEIQKIANQLAGNQTLMVSDRARNQKQIMINFLPLFDGKADFEINKENITNAGLNIAPDLLLLGGTDVDVSSLYTQTQRTLRRLKDQIGDLSQSYESKSKQIESLNQEILTRNQEIEDQSKEIDIQKRLFAEQMRRYRLQQEQMDAHAEELANVLKQVEVKQQTLDTKIELIQNQEQEISNQ
jgi:hypothetical protein